VAFLQRFLIASAFVLSSLGVAVAACGGRGASAPPANPERQSDVEYAIARDYFEKGQPRLALDHCLKAVDLNDQNVRALYFTSLVYLVFCDGKLQFTDPDCHMAEAETYARRALRVDGSFREAKNLLGQILIDQKKYAEAITVLEPLTRDPSFESSFLAWGNLGWAQVLGGQLDAGIESLEKAVTEPRFCVGHYRLGVARERKGDLAAAEQSLTNALEVDAPECKNLQDAWEERAQVRMKLGKVVDARVDFQKCRDISAETLAGRACLDALARIQ
jgi:type IV pilus assembly protein PilF